MAGVIEERHRIATQAIAKLGNGAVHFLLRAIDQFNDLKTGAPQHLGHVPGVIDRVIERRILVGCITDHQRDPSLCRRVHGQHCPDQTAQQNHPPHDTLHHYHDTLVVFSIRHTL